MRRGTCSVNPYQLAEGPALDALVHDQFFGGATDRPHPNYSTDVARAKQLQKKMQALYRVSVHCGRTRINGRNWFARYGTDPSTCTEVLAATYPLAICRLALLLAHTETPAADS